MKYCENAKQTMHCIAQMPKWASNVYSYESGMIQFHGRVAINKHYIIILYLLNFVFYIVYLIVSFRSFKYSRINLFIFTPFL